MSIYRAPSCLLFSLEFEGRILVASSLDGLKQSAHSALVATGRYGGPAAVTKLPPELANLLRRARQDDASKLDVWELIQLRNSIARFVDGPTQCALQRTIGHYIYVTSLKGEYLLRDCWPGICEWFIAAPAPKMPLRIFDVVRAAVIKSVFLSGLNFDQFEVVLFSSDGRPATDVATTATFGSYLVRPPPTGRR